VTRPVDTLRDIAAFFELDARADRWIERAAELVHGAPPPRLGDLPDDERARLADACRTGNALLGRPS
jgi:hypothetical protein